MTRRSQIYELQRPIRNEPIMRFVKFSVLCVLSVVALISRSLADEDTRTEQGRA